MISSAARTTFWRRAEDLAPMTRHVAIAFTVCLLIYVPGADAQPEASASNGQYEQAFDSMMEDPADPERSFDFAQAATEAGDLRGAIAALERILRINPGLANIQLELGVLYLRAGQADLAASYLRKAILAPDVPESVLDRAQTLLSRAERARSPHFFTGSISTAARYDSNANAGPESQQVRVLGEDLGFLEEGATGRNDFSAELVGAFTYAYALNSQAGHEIEANLLTYNRRYIESDEVNVNTIDLDVGPRFYLGPLLEPSLSVRPFVSAGYLWLDDDGYLRRLGGGLNLRNFFTSRLIGDVTVMASDQKFYDSPTREASFRSGPLYEVRSSLDYQVLAATRLTALASFGRRDSEVDFESFTEGEIRLGVTQNYPAPFALTPIAWSTSLFAGVRRTDYDEPDIAVDPDEKRQETRVDVTLTNNIRITPAVTAVVSALYTDNESTLPNFEYDNVGASIGLTWAF